MSVVSNRRAEFPRLRSLQEGGSTGLQDDAENSASNLPFQEVHAQQCPCGQKTNPY